MSMFSQVIHHKGRFMAVVLALGLAGAGLWQMSRIMEPRYQGRRLSEWLKQYDQCLSLPELSDAQRQLKRDSENAINAIGTNAIPYLLRELHDQRESISQAQEGRRKALAGFQALGAKGKNAIPALSRMVKDPELGLCALAILARFDDAAAVPALIPALSASNPRVRMLAVIELSHRGYTGDGVLPLLTSRLLLDPDPDVRGAAASGLSRFRGEAEFVVPALIRGLQDTNLNVQSLSAQSLGAFGEQAKSAAIALEKMVEQNGPGSPAAAALIQIDRTAAERISVARPPGTGPGPE